MDYDYCDECDPGQGLRTLTKEEIEAIWERMKTEKVPNILDVYPDLCDIANGLKWSAIEAQMEAEKEADD